MTVVLLAQITCPRCGGNGKVNEGTCPRCEGKGVVMLPLNYALAYGEVQEALDDLLEGGARVPRVE